MADAAKKQEGSSAYPPFVLGKPRFDQVELFEKKTLSPCCNGEMSSTDSGQQ